ncbi:hypothetical protein [Pseudodonghicola flavimaris]|uniref:Uncharacterized protein n=1 Tax=Pseudodonghicola flavimaris TaxID=3050036 RepID=A0ABT7EWB0_9RHOB|nr:hypothetical protein [Pseudodonghicola flavimaris]MDK3016621.1 hypothetical protein [Pseudodonghicola flavimaris]
MCSYDWIVMITLGLDRWQAERRPSPHEIELCEIRKQHEVRKAAETAKKRRAPGGTGLAGRRLFRPRG